METTTPTVKSDDKLIYISKELHKCLKIRAIREDKQIKELVHEIMSRELKEEQSIL